MTTPSSWHAYAARALEREQGSNREHQHIWGPRKGIGRTVALGIARGWREVTAVCVMCGKDKP